MGSEMCIRDRLPGMKQTEFDMHMKRVSKLARSLNPDKKKKISWWA